MKKSELRKLVTSADYPINLTILHDNAELIQSFLIDELHAWKDVEVILAWLRSDAEYKLALDKEEVRRARREILKAACYRHNFDYPPTGADQYEYLMKVTESDFFGGITLAALVQILDGLLFQMESEQDLRE